MRGRADVCKSWAFGLVLIWLAGCSTGPGPRTLRNNWVDYDSAYGDANNRQLLLNLARLANGEPVNFLQLGTFTAQYTYNASLGFNPNNVVNTPGYYTSSQTLAAGGSPATSEFTRNMLTLGGSAMAGISETPNFQFLPLTGSNIVAATLVPIDSKVFYTFYDQGYPADLVARTLVASVRRKIIVATTDKKFTTNYEYLVNSPYDRSYPDFLNFCSLLYRAQVAHIITVGNGPGGSTLIYKGPTQKMTDIVSAVQANLSVRFTNGLYEIRKPISGEKQFSPNLNENDAIYGLIATPSVVYPGPGHPVPAGDLRQNYYVADNHAEAGEINDVLSLAQEFKNNQLELKMQTVVSAMCTASQENTWYRSLTDKSCPYYIAFHRNAINTANAENTLTQINADKARLEHLVNKLSPAAHSQTTEKSEQAHEQSLDLNAVDTTEITDMITNMPSAGGLNIESGISDIKRHLNAINSRFSRSKHTDELRQPLLPPHTEGLTDPRAPVVVLPPDAPNTLTERFLPMAALTAVDVANVTTQAMAAIQTITDTATWLTNYLQCTIDFGHDHLGPFAVVTRLDKSTFQTRPLMKLTQEDGEDLPHNPTAEVFYNGAVHKPYFVADPVSTRNVWNVTQNRTVFTLLTYLYAQTSVSTQNLPVQQLIQVH